MLYYSCNLSPPNDCTKSNKYAFLKFLYTNIINCILWKLVLYPASLLYRDYHIFIDMLMLVRFDFRTNQPTSLPLLFTINAERL